jgi:hypothetical protein
MTRRRPEQVLEWLRTKPSLGEVQREFPGEWERVRRQVETLVAADDAEALRAYLADAARPVMPTQGHRPPDTELVAAHVRQYLTLRTLDQAYLASTTGVTSGTLRLGLVGGTVAQRLLFRRGLERKPVSYPWFRLLWPLVGEHNRTALMPLVREKGIYCFYTRTLLRRLAREIGDRRCLEIGAGDGTLAGFLAAEGVDVVATDDQSWADSVEYPTTVLRESATRALRAHEPTVVLCSWPPPGNPFERQVFATPSVGLYIVISTHHEMNAGNWPAYRAQQDFDLDDDVRLGRHVLPPSLDGAVLFFRRRPDPSRTAS